MNELLNTPSKLPAVGTGEKKITYLLFAFSLQVDENDGGDIVKDRHVYLEGFHWTKAELLGTGAFSSCYAARDKGSGTLMAVKQV